MIEFFELGILYLMVLLLLIWAVMCLVNVLLRTDKAIVNEMDRYVDKYLSNHSRYKDKLDGVLKISTENDGREIYQKYLVVIDSEVYIFSFGQQGDGFVVLKCRELDYETWHRLRI